MPRLCLLGLLLFTASVTVLADPLRVAVASNFLMPAKELAARFEKTSG